MRASIILTALLGAALGGCKQQATPAADASTAKAPATAPANKSLGGPNATEDLPATAVAPSPAKTAASSTAAESQEGSGAFSTDDATEHFTFRGADAQPFPGLKRISNDDAYVTLHYNPALTEVINTPAKQEEGEPVYHMLRTRLAGDATWYAVDCSAGPSADPMCTVYREDGARRVEVGTLGGESHFLPGNGAVYSNGRANAFFPAREKQILRGGKLVPVAQPFEYVGLESKTEAAISLRSKPTGGDIVAHLPAGAAVEVLLRSRTARGKDQTDLNHYLIRTEFGLVGWFTPTEYEGMKTNITGLRFYGD